MAERGTHVFCGARVYTDGAVVVGLSGGVRLRPVVSQGCEPIGEPWTVTGAMGHVLESIGSRPAYEVLVRTLESLSDRERARAARNLLIGLAIDEYRDEFGRGDFLIRNLMRIDSASGALAIGALPQVGQTVQFQVRDARAADEELRHLLAEAAEELVQPPAAALLFACNGRGAGLFGSANHDAQAASDLLGAPPLAGFFCNGEIGPVGGTTYLHGFTASFGLIVPNLPPE
jgi:small ligand-binding sensory domain FIST